MVEVAMVEVAMGRGLLFTLHFYIYHYNYFIVFITTVTHAKLSQTASHHTTPSVHTTTLLDRSIPVVNVDLKVEAEQTGPSQWSTDQVL